MNLEGEVLRIRDEICATAPEAYKEAFKGDQWKIAVYCAEAYYKNKVDDSNNVSTVEAESVAGLYREGRSVLYISLYFDTEMNSVVKELRRAKLPAPESEACSLPRLWDSYSNGIIEKSSACDMYGLDSPIRLLENPEVIRTKPSTKELKTLRKLYEDYPLHEIARLCNRPEDMVAYMLNAHPTGTDGMSMFARVANLYKSGKSVMYICLVLRKRIFYVENIIEDMKLRYCNGNYYSPIQTWLRFSATDEDFPVFAASPYVMDNCRGHLGHCKRTEEPAAVSGEFTEEERHLLRLLSKTTSRDVTPQGAT